MENDILILVDKNDNQIGSDSKENCHRNWKSKLHRAFSIIIFNDEGKMLITQRSASKKTWPLFWTNACCSHPRIGEETLAAAKRRLKEELGFSCNLKFLFKFHYDAEFDSEWGENEMDSVFVGKYSGKVNPNAGELAAFKFIGTDELKKDVAKNPGRYTPWFKKIVEMSVIEKAKEVLEL